MLYVMHCKIKNKWASSSSPLHVLSEPNVNQPSEVNFIMTSDLR